MSSKKKERSAAPVYQLKILLKGSSPPIWRRLLVTGDTSLAKLHRILQIVMGWYDCHLHQFVIHGRDYGVPDRELDFGQPTLNERGVRLSSVIEGPKDRFVYDYDFGDSWAHQIVVEKILPKETGNQYPVCTAGERACPPEDCGGIWGYADFLEAIRDPNHEEHESMLEWIGASFDPEAFNLDRINHQLRRVK
jgi:Plasmid pRiA4b ORF-3-like protein